jgi:stage II sporulation protein GA (sporulation sigma-E factor processing peptidase)
MTVKVKSARSSNFTQNKGSNKMKQIVYGDILFIVNFSMDFLALYFSGRLLHIKLGLIRLLSAAAIGGVFSIMSLFIGGSPILRGIIAALVSLVMCLIAAREGSIKSSLGYWFVFFISSALLGGLITAFYAFLNTYMYGINYYESENEKISVYTLLILAAVSIAAALLLSRIIKRRVPDEDISVLISEKDRSVKIDAFCDSGNFLKDPISGKSAIIIEAEALRNILPCEIYDASKKGAAESYQNLPMHILRKTRLLPASGIGGSSLCLGYIPESIKIIYKKHGKLLEKESDAIIALSPAPFEGAGDRAVVSSDLFCNI